MRPGRTAKPHWLTPNHSVWSPDSVISFDTETIESRDGDDLILSPRCWSLVWRLRHDHMPSLPRLTKRHGVEMGELAEYVADAARQAGETWIYAHNLAFDISVSSLPLRLMATGWHMEDCMLGSESSWWVLKCDGRKLILTDSWSWLRCSLEDAAKDLKRRKRELPANDDDIGAWLKRCDKDAELLSEAVEVLMAWWDTNRLGRWQMTGAGCGWASARHQIRPKSILVGPDPARTPLERSAIHGGRKEVFHVGRVNGTIVADFDFQNAYPRITAAHRLPTRPEDSFASMTVETFERLGDDHDVIANVEVTTDTPCAPCRIDGETWWPVGRFMTTLCGPEIRYAISKGARVQISDGWRYRMGRPLADWADWQLRILAANPDHVPALVRRMVKHWGRAVVGRFAAHSSQVIAERPAEHPGWSLSTGADLATGVQLDILSIGGTEYVIAKDQEGADAFPALFAFVEAHCRVALAQMLDKRPQACILQCNTDGWLEARIARDGKVEIDGAPWPHVVVRKGIWNDAIVLGPNHLDLPHRRRFSGIAMTAQQDGDGAYRWHDWPSLRWQLERGEMGRYRRPARAVELTGPFVRRWVLATGDTVPVTVLPDGDGAPAIQPWDKTWDRRNGDMLAPHQVTALEALRGDSDLAPVIFDDKPYAVRGRGLQVAVSKRRSAGATRRPPPARGH